MGLVSFIVIGIIIFIRVVVFGYSDGMSVQLKKKEKKPGTSCDSNICYPGFFFRENISNDFLDWKKFWIQIIKNDHIK